MNRKKSKSKLKFHSQIICDETNGVDLPLAFICWKISDSSLTTPSFFAKSGDFIANSAKLFCIKSESSTFKRFNDTFGGRAMIASISRLFMSAGCDGCGGGSSGNTFCSGNFGSCEKTALLFDRISLISSSCLLARC